jgi:hypothetical protein
VPFVKQVLRRCPAAASTSHTPNQFSLKSSTGLALPRLLLSDVLSPEQLLPAQLIYGAVLLRAHGRIPARAAARDATAITGYSALITKRHEYVYPKF